MSADKPVTEQDWEEWDRREKYVRKHPLKRDLLRAQAKVVDMLNRVIRDGETIVINGDDGAPAAALVPYAEFIRLEQR